MVQLELWHSTDIIILVGRVMYDTEHRCGLICEGWRMKHTFDVWNKHGVSDEKGRMG